MSKKKRFGISEALTRGLSETIYVVENNSGMFRNVILPLSRIELDPDNPRKLAINLNDVKHGIKTDDPLYLQKQAELEKLKELAHTVKSSGIINPIVVYKLGEVYRVVAGERRCLASFLIGKQEIEARILNEKPKGFDLKLIQWVENTAREDLTLAERLDNIREIIREYCHLNDNVHMTASLLKNITGLSLSQTTYYLNVLNAPEDVLVEIQNGTIRNLDKAALLASIASTELRQQAILSCINGSSLKEIRNMINYYKSLKKPKADLLNDNRGRSANKINMGTTTKSEVIKEIIKAVLAQQSYAKHIDIFSQTNWEDFRQSKKAFRKLIEILELEMVI